MDWMIINPSLESKLSLERMCRSIWQQQDLQEVQQLCEALTRQNFHQSVLLQQAVGHIGSLEQKDISSARE